MVPVLVCALLILIRGLVEVTEFNDDFHYLPNITTHISEDVLGIQGVNRVLAYSPTNPVLHNLVTNVANEFNFAVVPQGNAEDLQNYAMTFQPFASIEFDDSLMVSFKMFNFESKLKLIITT